MSEQPQPKIGDIWREVDPRFTRHVRVFDVQQGRRGIAVRTCVKTEGNWRPAPRSRLSWCDRERFNGKRCGYAFVESESA